ncbi:tail fiber domain-containing protein [Thioclava sp. A2]|uniref:tail fiber domain-containing protein n=1 Tax=Thioclava sp. FCG-A2 TaxID=3080562 RepID=UPI0029541347|nr:tail fiber domain-containing protein [Thioclava sp. A2]MDV7272076.1 tail fiber domain-containing protein [Thioclava sp. A2]
MANTMLLKRTTVAGRVPTVAQLSAGELAVNVTDGKLYLKRVAGSETVVELGQVGPQGPAGADGSPDTAAQVLAKLITVDGAGSGLDADLLDGLQASSFAQLSGATFTGVVTAPNFVSSSDARLKSDITPITEALAKVQALHGVTFRMVGSDARQMGLIAQEVQAVAPEAVVEAEDVLRLAYGNLVGLLVEAIKDLACEVSQLKRSLP